MLSYPVRCLVDKRVLAEKEVSLGVGISGVGLIMQVETLLQGLAEYELGDFVTGE